MEIITLNLPPAYLAVINKGLLHVPYGEAAPVVNHINAEIQAQFDKQRDAQMDTDDSDPKGAAAAKGAAARRRKSKATKPVGGAPQNG